MKAVDILNKHGLKRTSCREGILDVVMGANRPLAENEIRENLAGNYDRTTFYRSFKTLEEHGILHKIVVDNQQVRYALDISLNHKEAHAHFYCNVCHNVSCMDNIPVQEYQLPDGFSEETTEVLIKGICSQCHS